MKRNFRGTLYLFTGLLLANAALAPIIYTGDTETRTALAHEIPGVNIPAVTARFVETRTTQLAAPVQAPELTAEPVQKIEIPEDTVPAFFPRPVDPIPEAQETVNLIVTGNDTYRLELMKERRARATLVH